MQLPKRTLNICRAKVGQRAYFYKTWQGIIEQLVNHRFWRKYIISTILQ